jgi:hypothetical protein
MKYKGASIEYQRVKGKKPPKIQEMQVEETPNPEDKNLTPE